MGAGAGEAWPQESEWHTAVHKGHLAPGEKGDGALKKLGVYSGISSVLFRDRKQFSNISGCGPPRSLLHILLNL